MINNSFLSKQIALIGAGLVALVGITTPSLAYVRYGTGSSNCRLCHGDFTGSTSPQGTVFPSGDKHEMHRGSSYMDTACDLCHTSGDNRNPYIGSSNGTSNNPGLGCSGCHQGPGLRAHHQNNGVTLCAECHEDGAPLPENSKPPYYGTADTKVDNPCNDQPTANQGENWSVGDFIGLDNDGDNLYDLADFDCGPPYLLLDVVMEGADVRITWETVGGRTDIVQEAAKPEGPYADVSPATAIPGLGVVTRDHVVTGGAAGGVRFYRIRSAP